MNPTFFISPSAFSKGVAVVHVQRAIISYRYPYCDGEGIRPRFHAKSKLCSAAELGIDFVLHADYFCLSVMDAHSGEIVAHAKYFANPIMETWKALREEVCNFRTLQRVVLSSPKWYEDLSRMVAEMLV